ncbi:MAG: DUF4870 domain-containing protein [Flavobacterium sp.]
METTSEKNIATFTHLSTLSQYIIPFGNYIFPILIWTSKKDQSEFVNYHGKQAINFQLSMLIYSLIMAAIALPILFFVVFNNMTFNDFYHHHDFKFTSNLFENNITIITLGIMVGLLFVGIKIAEFFLIIIAAVKTSNGEKYKYPLTIPFIK